MPPALLPMLPYWLEALLIAGLLATAAYLSKRVSRGGALGGWVLASVIYWALGWPGIVPPLTFFIVANLATSFGYRQKAERGIEQEDGGRRGAKHALANVTAGMLFALAIRAELGPASPLVWGYLATFATACADTVSSEIGQVLGKTPIHPLTFRRMQPGEEGAVSVEGTLAGLLGALLIGLSGVSGLYASDAILLSTGGIVLAAGIANWLESALGSTLGAKLTNEQMNFFNTVAGGLIAWTIASWLLSRQPM